MNNRLLMSVAAAALIAGSGFASAQNPGGAGTAPSGGSAGMSREAPAGGAARSGATSAPAGGASADRAAPAERNAPVNKDEATDTTNKSDQKPAMKSTQSDDKMQRDDKRATDSTRDSGKASKDMKADSKTGDMKSGADTKYIDGDQVDHDHRSGRRGRQAHHRATHQGYYRHQAAERPAGDQRELLDLGRHARAARGPLPSTPG